MRTRARSQLKFDLNSFSFAVTPQELILDQRLPLTPEAVFFLEIEKGVQLVASIPQKIPSTKQNLYLLKVQPTSLKVFNPKTASYSFSLYLQQNEEISYLDSFALDLLTPFESYSKELNSHQYEYSRIMEAMSNNVELGSSWSTLKHHLREYRHQVQVSGKMAKIKYVIQIVSDIDEYDAKIQKKNRVLSKTSQESKKSDSSGQKEGIIENKILEEKQNSKRSVLTSFQSKSPSSLIKREENEELSPVLSKHFQEENTKNIPETQLPQEVQPSSELSHEQVKLFLPLQSVLQNQKNQNLSDIIEQSYEGESNLNSNQRTDRRWRELPEIIEENPRASYLELRKINTEHFLPEKQEDATEGLRRGGSLDELHNIQSENQIQQQKRLKKIEEESVEESLQNTRDSFSHSFDFLCDQLAERKKIKTLLLMSLLILVWFALSFAVVIKNGEKSTFSSLKKGSLRPKYNILSP